MTDAEVYAQWSKEKRMVSSRPLSMPGLFFLRSMMTYFFPIWGAKANEVLLLSALMLVRFIKLLWVILLEVILASLFLYPIIYFTVGANSVLLKDLSAPMFALIFVVTTFCAPWWVIFTTIPWWVLTCIFTDDRIPGFIGTPWEPPQVLVAEWLWSSWALLRGMLRLVQWEYESIMDIPHPVRIKHPILMLLAGFGEVWLIGKIAAHRTPALPIYNAVAAPLRPPEPPAVPVVQGRGLLSLL